MLRKWRYVLVGLLFLSCILILVNVQYITNDRIYILKTLVNISDFDLGAEVVKNSQVIKDNLLEENSIPLKKEVLEISDYSEVVSSVSKGTSQSLKTILLLSSVGRSGSSFLGELLGSQDHSIFLYEPVRAMPKNLQDIESEVQDELERNFHCHFRSSFLNYGPHVSVRHPYTLGKSKKEVSLAKLEKFCEQEPVRIIKTIRTRLSWTKRLLEDKNLNMKVIHLVRDPRGSYHSILDLEWKMNAQQMCQRISEDIRIRDEMIRDFPGRYLFIKYEDFCLHPYEKTSEIFRFLKGENSTFAITLKEDIPPHQNLTNHKANQSQFYPDIPEKALKYLESHIHSSLFSERSHWTTVRDSSTVYQNWRRKITEDELLDVEKYCDEVLTILGHRPFGSVQSAKNMSVSLFL